MWKAFAETGDADTRDAEHRRNMQGMGMGKGTMNLVGDTWVRDSGTEILRWPTYTWLIISWGLLKISISKDN